MCFHIVMYSNTLRLFFRLIKILPKERRRSLYQIIPLAIITGIVQERMTECIFQ